MNDTDCALFKSLRTNFFQDFEDDSVPALKQVVSAIKTYMEKVSEFYNSRDNPRSKSFPFTKEYIEVLVRQATPQQMLFHTILIMVGKDTTLEQFRRQHQFLDGDGAAGDITRQILRQLKQIALGRDTPPEIDPPWFPFVDLCPWLDCDDYEDEAMGYLHQYVLSVNPCIIMTFGHRVSSVVSASFLHPYGIAGYIYLS
jgi:hypothetical protein